MHRQKIEIANLTIADDAPVFVIAEAGVNHGGDFHLARQMVLAAKECGADAVKFQAFRSIDLASPQAEAVSYQRWVGATGRVARTQRELLRSLELSRQQLRELKSFCEESGVTFLATPFGIEQLHWLVEMEVAALKIASPDITNLPLLEAAASSGLPLIVSTGAATEEEIAQAMQVLRENGCRQAVLLHCVSSYPAPLEQLNLRAIGTMRSRFGVLCGFSDHSLQTMTGALAVAAGAVMLEKHFTLSRELNGPDQAFSLEPAQLAEYIKLVRLAEQARGDGIKRSLEIEQETRKLTRSSLVAARPIHKGQRIEREMLTVKRPGTGIEPSQLQRLVGMRAAVDIDAEQLIQWHMLESNEK